MDARVNKEKIKKASKMNAISRLVNGSSMKDQRCFHQKHSCPERSEEGPSEAGTDRVFSVWGQDETAC